VGDGTISDVTQNCIEIKEAGRKRSVSANENIRFL
jgi:hypothetical protein